MTYRETTDYGVKFGCVSIVLILLKGSALTVLQIYFKENDESPAPLMSERKKP